ncbi:MAG: hypothetical protein VX077_10400, partial [Pseudomonadota bacterium]|nr:hypothetical protein [Pseudomonadota bacterium]
GALLDSELLAEVYLELKGGRQPGLSLDVAAPRGGSKAGGSAAKGGGAAAGDDGDAAKAFPRRDFTLEAPDKGRHEAFLRDLKEPIWSKYGVKAADPD